MKLNYNINNQIYQIVNHYGNKDNLFHSNMVVYKVVSN